MAELAIAAAGAAFGSWALPAGFLGMSGASIGWMASTFLTSAIVGGRHQHGPRLGDRRVQGTAYGQAFPWVFGSPRMAGQIVWASPMREIANTQKVGKGGSQKVTTYTYEVDLLIAFTENMTEGLAREWLNGELVILGTTIKAGVWSGYTFYPGDADQAPDPTYEAYVGVGKAPAFRGRPTLMVRGLQLGQSKVPGNLTSEFAATEPRPQDLGFLCQFESFVTSGSLVESEIGPNVPVSVGTLTLDTSTKKFGDASVRGRWNVPINLSQNLNSRSWRLEGWLYLRGNNNTSNVMYVYTNTGASFEVSFSDAGITPQPFLTNLITQNISYGGAFGQTGQRPANGQWMHWAIQQDVPNKRWSFFAAGKYHGGDVGALIPWVGTQLNLNISPAAITPYDTNADSTTFRWLDDADDFYPLGDYSVPTQAFGIPISNPAPWYELTGDPDGLMKAVTALMLRAGYHDSQFDVSGLAGIPLLAYQTGEVANTRAQLETLRPYGQFECAATDKIYIFKRETTPAGVIDWRDLRASEDPNDQGEPFEITFANEMELPAQIQLTYPNMNADYNEGSVHSDRLVSAQLTTQSVQIAVGMTPDMAKRIVDGMLNDMLASLGRATVRLPRKYAKYRPGQVVTLTTPDGDEYRLRILVKRDSLIIIEWDVTLDDPNVLEGFGDTDLGAGPTTEISQLAQTEWQMLALRPLRDADATTPGAYVAVTPTKVADNDDWPGAVFVRARLPGAYEQQFTTGEACVIGECLTTLGDFPAGSTVFDTTQTLRVRVRGELESSNWDDFFQDRTVNAAVVGNEPIRFLTATFVENDGQFKVYDITSIMRGQLGFEGEIAGHTSGERFVLLNNSIRHMGNETTDIGQTHEVKAVTLNLLLDDVEGESFVDTGIALKPLSPVSLLAIANVGGDLDVSFVRRSRLVARFTDTGCFTPLGEATEAYVLRVYDDPDADPVRTVPLTTTAWAYEAADIASDGFTSGDPITITVTQVSDSVGEGDAATIEVEAP